MDEKMIMIKMMGEAVEQINDTLGRLIKQTQQIVDIIAQQDEEIELLKEEMKALQKNIESR